MVGSGTTIIPVGREVILGHKNISLRSFATMDELVECLLADTLAQLASAIRQNGRASWAVSGGSTPAPLFDAARKADLNWSSVDIALVDERWVPPSHPRSNEAFIKNRLLQDHAANASFTGMFKDGSALQDALPMIEADYQKLAQPFSSVLLGMGNDGHTASLFPAAEGLEHAMSPNNSSLCAAISARQSDVTGEETDRITLTAHAIKSASAVSLMLSGQQKLDTLTHALKSATDLPIARIIDGLDHPITVYWAA